MRKGVYKFDFDCCYADISGIFVADEKEIKNAMGEEVYLGEIAGKHSEIYFNLEDEHIKLVTFDPQVIKIFEEYDLSSGTNPLEYIFCPECDLNYNLRTKTCGCGWGK